MFRIKVFFFNTFAYAFDIWFWLSFDVRGVWGQKNSTCNSDQRNWNE